MVGWTVVWGLGLLAGFNPGWPPGDPNLDGAALARPDNQPDDPAFAPWTRAGDCSGQAQLYGFTPPCAASFAPSAEAVPTGASVDRAWLRSIGDPRVLIAIVSDGVDLRDPRVGPIVRLNPGEIPGQNLDRNGDGALTVHDFTTATATEAPTLDKVIDPRLLARADRGDVDGDGRLGPLDLVTVFSNGVDDDGDGLVDDIAGWDFLEADNDPSARPSDRRGTSTALAAAERGNDGVGGIGACPRCTILPLRVGAAGLAGADAIGWALLYAVERGSSVAALVIATPGPTPFLARAASRAAARGVLGVIDAGPSTYPSMIEDLPLDDTGFLRVTSTGFEVDLASSRHPRASLPCAKGTPALDLAVSGGTCPDTQAAGVVAGVVGLLVEAARRGSPGGVTPALLAAAVRASARPDSRLARSPEAGIGRLDARAAIDAVLDRRLPPAPRWRSPVLGAVVDPTSGQLRVVGDVERVDPTDRVTWTIGLGSGLRPERFDRVASGTIEPGTSTRVDAVVPLAGLFPDPAGPSRSLDDRALTLRLTARSSAESSAEGSADRVIFAQADLDLFPGFPVSLGSGAFGGPRIVDGDGDGEPEIWVGLLDGRLVGADGRGRIRTVIAGRAAPVPPGAEGWAGGGLPRPGVAYLGAPSAARIDTRWVIGAVAGDRVLVRVEGGEARFVGEPAPRIDAAPAGAAVQALVVPATDVFPRSRFAWPGVDGIRRETAEGSDELWLGRGGRPGPLALDRRSGRSVVWTRIDDELAATDGSRVELQRPLLVGRGLARLRPSAPIVASLRGSGVGVVLRVQAGIVVWFDEDQPPARFALDATDAAPSLSGDGARSLGWFRAPDGTGPPRPRALPEAAENEPTTLGLDPTQAEVAIVDVDGGRPEWLFGGDAGRLFALSENGRQAVAWPKATGQPVMGTPAVGDLDGDGRFDVVAVTRDGRLFAWRTRGRPERVQWAGERHDLGASANPSSPVGGPIQPDDSGCRCAGPFPAREADARPRWILVAAGAATAGRRRRRRPEGTDR